MLVNWSRIVSKACGGPCSCDATPAADTDMPVSSEASGEWVSVYAVPKMDCPSEERMIRLALNGFDEIRTLSFDLSNRRLEVVHDGEAEPITAKLATLGLGASLQETVIADPETIKAAESSASPDGGLQWYDFSAVSRVLTPPAPCSAWSWGAR